MSEELIWRLTLADDHPVIVRGLKQLVEASGTFRVVATAADGVAAEADIRRLQPDVAVLDVHMAGKSGIEVLRALIRDRVRTRVALLTASLSESLLLEAIKLGAHGIVLKEAEPDMLIACFTQVAQGGRWIDRELARRAEVATRSDHIHPTHCLTSREVEIMELVAQGRGNRAIAERTAISEGTVKIHLHNIYQKLGVTNRTELAAISLNRRPSA